jgi:FAD/FMN-containing dehydrogenase
VTADGHLLTASAEENPDLFWALRGGSGNFGVVTSFEYRLHAVGPTIFGGMIAYPLSRAKEVLRVYRELIDTAPDELTAYAGLVTPPGAETIVALFCCYCGPLEKGGEVLAPLMRLGALQNALGPMPYLMQQRIFDDGFPNGAYYYTKADFLPQLSDEAIDVVIEYATKMPSPLSGILFQTVCGAASRIATDATAFRHRAYPYAPIIVSQWGDEREADTNIRWARDCGNALHRFAGDGVYVNDLGEDDQDRVRIAYGGNYERLATLKQKYDPNNVFHLNPNIKPLLQ